MRHGAQPGQARLEHVISGAAFHRFDGGFLSWRIGNENERHRRMQMARSGERRPFMGRHQCVIRKNQVRRQLQQDPVKFLFAIHLDRGEIQIGRPQGILDQLCVGGRVFQDQHGQLFSAYGR